MRRRLVWVAAFVSFAAGAVFACRSHVPTAAAAEEFERVSLTPAVVAVHRVPTRDEVIRSALEGYELSGVARHITPELIKAIIEVESSGRTRAYSNKGAIGLMQVMPLHTKSLKNAGIIASTADLWEEEANIRAGIYILMGYARRSRSIAHALACYNAGAAGAKCGGGKGYASKVLAVARGL